MAELIEIVLTSQIYKETYKLYEKIECRKMKSLMTTGGPLGSNQGPLMPGERKPHRERHPGNKLRYFKLLRVANHEGNQNYFLQGMFLAGSVVLESGWHDVYR